MKIDRFITPTWLGHININDNLINEYKNWSKFEKELDPYGATLSTTVNGWQYIFNQTDKDPDWLKILRPEINKIKDEIQWTRLKTMWVIDYEIGGYQDPHFHNVGVVQLVSIIINLIGNGQLILQDPRPIAQAQGVDFANVIELAPGDWCAFPSYIIHNSRPCNEYRSILVLDAFTGK